MKKRIFILLLLGLFLMGFKLFTNPDPYIPPSEQAVNQLLGYAAKRFTTKYNICPIATNVAMPGGIVKLLGLDFQVKGPLSKIEIRRLLISLSDEFLFCINDDLELRPYLEQYPFTIQNVEIDLFLVDSNRRDLNHPYIGIAGISKGKLDYLTLTRTDIPEIVSENIELYEDALECIKDIE